jgi:hypothetical protein
VRAQLEQEALLLQMRMPSDRPSVKAAAAGAYDDSEAGPSGNTGTYYSTSADFGYNGGFYTPEGFLEFSAGDAGGRWNWSVLPNKLSPDEEAANTAAHIAATIAAARQPRCNGSRSAANSHSSVRAAYIGRRYVGTPCPSGAAARNPPIFPHGRSAASSLPRRRRPLPPPPHVDCCLPLKPISSSISNADQESGLPVTVQLLADGWS